MSDGLETKTAKNNSSKKSKIKVLTAKIDSEYWEKNFEERGLKLIPDKTGRGFSHWAFDDIYGQHCSLQASSLASEGAIWIGVDNTGPDITGVNGTRNEDTRARMHLTRKQVEQLLPLLHRFVETGDLP